MDKLDEFRGYEFILQDGGALATAEVMARGEISFAHVFPNGEIKCFNKVIGHLDELNVLDDELDIPVGAEVLFQVWTKETWEEAWADRKHILMKDVTPE